MVDGLEPIPRWIAAGVWARLLAMLQQVADREGRPDWTTYFVDGTVVPLTITPPEQSAVGTKRSAAAAD